MKYQVEGGKKLSGVVKISGNKNSLFPCVAAALLCQEDVILTNVPNIRDCAVLVEILKDLGVSVAKNGDNLSINASELKKYTLNDELVSKLRGSVVLAGALLSRLGRVTFHHPGGDIIGKRSIKTHIDGFVRLGAKVKISDLHYHLEGDLSNKKEDLTIFLEEASVTAVENIVLASVIGSRRVVLKNCSKEPHIVDLCFMLNQMGAKISGIGTDTLEIDAVNALHGTEFRLGADFVEAGTYIIAAVITGGRVKLTNLNNADLDPIIYSLQKFGIKIVTEQNEIISESAELRSVEKITTNIWPGFPTDMMSVVIVLASQSKGVTICHDWMYESRMFFVDKLISMGANITIADPHRVFVYGPTRLKGRVLATPDIRAGMALVLAALVARGKSVINQAELIERGYEDVVEKLTGLGASIEKIA